MLGRQCSRWDRGEVTCFYVEDFFVCQFSRKKIFPEISGKKYLIFLVTLLQWKVRNFFRKSLGRFFLKNWYTHCQGLYKKGPYPAQSSVYHCSGLLLPSIYLSVNLFECLYFDFRIRTFINNVSYYLFFESLQFSIFSNIMQ